MNVKQVIVMRTKYPDGEGGTKTLRKGKLIAQGSHAAMAWLSNRINSGLMVSKSICSFSQEELAWLKGKFTKVVLQVETEEELLQVLEKAKEAGLNANLITDSGATEFHGVATHTCLAIGPHEASKIDAITGDLKLY